MKEPKQLTPMRDEAPQRDEYTADFENIEEHRPSQMEA
jgi:hypothetical protein